MGTVDKRLELYASATRYVSTESPPLLVLHGLADELVLPNQAHRIVEAYQQAGLKTRLVLLEGAGHGGGRFFSGEPMQAAIDFLKTSF